MIDHNFYASPVQASQTLITHILEAMDKELERPFTIALSGGDVYKRQVLICLIREGVSRIT